MIDGTRLQYLIVLLAISAFILTGCLSQAPETNPGPGYFQERFEFHDGVGYEVNGTLLFQVPGGESATFQQFTICAFNERGDIVNSTNLGNLTAPSDEMNVSISADGRPRYIVVNHPGFEEYEAQSGQTIDPLTITWTESYVSIRHQNPSEEISTFNYNPPVEAGECVGPGE